MDQNPSTDIYAKSKYEEPNPDLPLHLSLRKPDGSPIGNCYIKIFEDPGKTLQLAEAIASGKIHVRKVHRIRNKELVKFIDKDFEGLKDIHVTSKATIGLIANAQSDLLNHTFLDLVGTVDEVNAAEKLIIDSVLKTYSSQFYPIILMTPKICWDKINIPLHKVCRVLGSYENNLLRTEMESGTWIKIEHGPSPGNSEWDRVVNIFGPRENVNKAKTLVQSAVADQPGELSAVEALNEFLRQFKEPSCAELIDHKKYDDVEPDKKKQKVGEHSWNQTYLRPKKSGGGKSEGSKQIEGESSEGNKNENEFKVPSWSQTFGWVISCDGESEGSKEREEVKDKEDSSEPEKEKEPVVQAEEGGSGLPEGNAAAGC